MNTRICFIRHGESEYNKLYSHLVGGRSNDTPLSTKGIEQSELLGKYLLNKEVKFDKVYSSPAVRAIGTANIVMGIQKYPLEEILVFDELLELDQGDWTWKLRDEMYTPEIRKIIALDPWNFAPPNGESQRQVEERMLKFVYQNILNKRHEYNTDHSIAIFGHGTAIKCTLRGIMNSNPKLTYKMVLENTSITEFVYDGSTLNLSRFNDTSHLG